MNSRSFQDPTDLKKKYADAKAEVDECIARCQEIQNKQLQATMEALNKFKAEVDASIDSGRSTFNAEEHRMRMARRAQRPKKPAHSVHPTRLANPVYSPSKLSQCQYPEVDYTQPSSLNYQDNVRHGEFIRDRPMPDIHSCPNWQYRDFQGFELPLDPTRPRPLSKWQPLVHLPHAGCNLPYLEDRTTAATFDPKLAAVNCEEALLSSESMDTESRQWLEAVCPQVKNLTKENGKARQNLQSEAYHVRTAIPNMHQQGPAIPFTSEQNRQ